MDAWIVSRVPPSKRGRRGWACDNLLLQWRGLQPRDHGDGEWGAELLPEDILICPEIPHALEEIQAAIQRRQSELFCKLTFNMLYWYMELLLKPNKTARIRAKPWMFRLPFKLYGAVIALKNSMKKKTKWNFFFLKCEIFYENHPPTRHIKYKRIDFAPCNKPIMANKLLLLNLERFLRRINSPLTR